MWHISSKNHGYLTLKFNPRHVKNYFIDYPYKEMYYVQITMSALCLFLLQLQIRFFLSCWANVRPSVECNYLNQTNGQPLMVQQNFRIDSAITIYTRGSFMERGIHHPIQAR